MLRNEIKGLSNWDRRIRDIACMGIKWKNSRSKKELSCTEMKSIEQLRQKNKRHGMHGS